MQQQPDTSSIELIHAAAKRGVRQAQALYGQLILDGRIQGSQPAAALYWFERAAQGGDVMAINMVGRCLDQGWGVAASPHLAAPWFRKAAERGSEWGMYNLATLLVLGSGVAEDRQEAFHWLQRAAGMGHAKSMNLLGGFYEDGWVVARSLTKAREQYEGAANGGDFRGQFNFARMLADEGATGEAVRWLHLSLQTATPAFVEKMKSFLKNSAIAEFQSFASSLRLAAPDAAA